MKNILFIVLPYLVNINERKDAKTVKLRSFKAFPYGVISLASYVKKNIDWNVKIFDCNYDNFEEDLINIIKEFNPSIVALSMMFDNSYQYINSICNIIKNYEYNTPIILGGAATAFAQEDILNEQKNIDAVCYGEGERPLYDLLSNIIFKNNKIDLNVYYQYLLFHKSWVTRYSIENKIKNEKINITNLDEVIDLDYSLIDINDYSKMEQAFSPHIVQKEINQFFMVSSRGCPFYCVTGNTIIHTLFGDVPIEKLSKKYNKIPVLTRDKITKKLIYADAINIKKYKSNAEILRVYFNNTYIDCTPDHKFLVYDENNNEYEIEAQFLKIGQRVNSINIAKNIYGYKDIQNVSNCEVIKIIKLPYKKDVYCLEVPGYDWFYANNVLIHNCSFCMNSGNEDKTVRYASVDAIIKHVDYLVKTYNMNVLTFYDDQILYNLKRAKELFKALSKYKLRIEMPNGISVAYIDEELVDLMWEAGVDTVYLAIESGSPFVIKNLIHKPINLKTVKDKIKLFRKYNYWILGYFVTGLPGETDTHRQETIDFIKDAGFDWISFSLASPVRGSSLFKLCKENNYIKGDFKIGTFDMTQYQIETPEYSKEYIKRKNYLMNLEVNFINNYRMLNNDLDTAKWIFTYIINKYPNHALAYYYLYKITNENNYLEKCKNIIKEDFLWDDCFKYFKIGV